MKKLYVCDLDGTLLKTPFDRIPEKLFQLIRVMRKNGVYFAVATGRQSGNVRKLFQPVAGEIYLIADNGGTTYAWDKLLRMAVMDEGREEELIDDILNTESVYLEMTGLTTGYMTKKDGPLRKALEGIHEEKILDDPHLRPEPVTKISLNELGRKSVSEKTSRFFHEKYDGIYSVAESGNGWLDIYPKHSGKGKALRFLISELKLKKEEVVVFGDHENDVPMFKEAGLSYSREYSLPHVQKESARVTEDPISEIEKLLMEDLQ